MIELKFQNSPNTQIPISAKDNKARDRGKWNTRDLGGLLIRN